MWRPNNQLKWYDIERNPYCWNDGELYTQWCKNDDLRKEKIRTSYKIWLRNKLGDLIYKWLS